MFCADQIIYPSTKKGAQIYTSYTVQPPTHIHTDRLLSLLSMPTIFHATANSSSNPSDGSHFAANLFPLATTQKQNISSAVYRRSLGKPRCRRNPQKQTQCKQRRCYLVIIFCSSLPSFLSSSLRLSTLTLQLSVAIIFHEPS